MTMAKTKTEELTKEIAIILVKVIKADRSGRQTEVDAVARILKLCQEAGLAFVAKDAKLPHNPYSAIYERSVYKEAQQDMCKQDWEKTEEIDTREPRLDRGSDKPATAGSI